MTVCRQLLSLGGKKEKKSAGDAHLNTGKTTRQAPGLTHGFDPVTPRLFGLTEVRLVRVVDSDMLLS